jgi:hypothetical protein
LVVVVVVGALVVVVVVGALVVVVVGALGGHGYLSVTIKSPCFSWACHAFTDTLISTHGFFSEPVLWQMVTFLSPADATRAGIKLPTRPAAKSFSARRRLMLPLARARVTSSKL